MGDNSALRSIDRSVVASAPVRSPVRLMPARVLLVRQLLPHRGRLSLATLAFRITDSPVWLLPPITAAVLDIVGDRGPCRSCGSGRPAPWPC